MNIKFWLTVGFSLGLGIFSTNTEALPTFARQTGMPCNSCHNGNFLALNAFGRNFKLKGYTLTTAKNIEKKSTKDNSSYLSLPELPGISAMMQISLTNTKADIPGQQNNAVRLPQQLSLFLAGRLSDHMGIFSQFTYANGDSGFAMDNTDLRYANSTLISGKTLDFGFTLDNNPTVGDLWNSTPAWGFPYSGSDIAAGPSAGDFLSSLGGAVGGIGAYGMLDNKFYGKFSLYRNTNTNSIDGSENVLKNSAPYWRLAWQTNFNNDYLMIGTYGISARVYPQAFNIPTGVGGPSSKYLDTAIDFQYEHPLSGNNSLVMHGSYLNEKRTDLDMNGGYLAGNNSTWNFAKFDIEYNLDNKWRPGVVLFNANTGDDNLDNNGYILDLSYFPAENLQFQAQYTAYNKFDGISSNSSDNNSLFFMFWLMM